MTTNTSQLSQSNTTSPVSTASKSTPTESPSPSPSMTTPTLTPTESPSPSTTECPLEPLKCPTDIFRPAIDEEVRTWYVEYNSQKAEYFCHINFYKVAGDNVRTCDGDTGEWTGREIKCVPDPIYTKYNIFMYIVIIVSVASTLILIGDFILRRCRKMGLRQEKARLMRLQQVRAVNGEVTTRIRPFPSLKPDFVMKNTYDIDPTTDYMSNLEVSEPNFLRKTDKDNKKSQAVNLFTRLHPKISLL